MKRKLNSYNILDIVLNDIPLNLTHSFFAEINLDHFYYFMLIIFFIGKRKMNSFFRVHNKNTNLGNESSENI